MGRLRRGGRSLCLYLRQSLVRRAVALELEDVDVIVRLHDAVGTSLALFLLGIDRVDAYQAEDESKRVVEEAFLFRLVFLASH